MHQFQKTFASNHNTYFNRGHEKYCQTINALLWKSLQNHHIFLRSKFDLPPPPPKKKHCLISPPSGSRRARIRICQLCAARALTAAAVRAVVRGRGLTVRPAMFASQIELCVLYWQPSPLHPQPACGKPSKAA